MWYKISIKDSLKVSWFVLIVKYIIFNVKVYSSEMVYSNVLLFMRSGGVNNFSICTVHSQI
jgi:capsule polysaccharide export protein KpsE/RkpR